MEDSSEWQPDPALADFLAGGDAPVYVGFGSMPGLNPVVLTKSIVNALNHAGKRGVLATGGGALLNSVTASHVHMIEGAPQDKLFPLMSACIRHGGAGTTAAALRAGRPQIICSFFGDQPFWALRMADLGVATDPLTLKRLTANTLTFHIIQATRGETLRRAQAVARSIAAEDGVGTTVGFLQSAGLLNRIGLID